MRKRTLVAGVILSLVWLPGLGAEDAFPRTANGKPDLTGVYDIASLTPYTRPEEFGAKLYITAEEAREIEQAAAEREAKANSPSDPGRAAPELGANVGGYNRFWLDPGTTRFTVDDKYRTSIITDPPNGQLPPLLEAGEKRRAGLRRGGGRGHKNTGTAWWLEEGGGPYDDPEGMSMLDRCLYIGAVTVPIRPVVYNNAKTIVQTDTHVVIHIEWMHWARVVRINSEHHGPEFRSLAGDSIGWWEGDTLVVETTNFLDRPGVPRKNLRVVERFNPIDGDSLLYGFTVHDPDYAAPYSGEFPWPKADHANWEYACHEGNYSMGNTLRGARLLEKEWLQQQGK